MKRKLSYSAIIFNCLFIWSCQTANSDKKNVSSADQSSTVAVIDSFDKWFDDIRPLVSAHRGGPYPGYPENAIETFQYIIDQTPALIECDISMTKDSVLIMMHDNTLDRTTTGIGPVLDYSFVDLQNLLLKDNNGDTTVYRIPTLDETLSWGKGKALFTLDVKKGVPFEKVVDAVERFDAASYAAIITYRIQDAKLVHSLNPEIVISVSAGDDAALAQIMKSEIPAKNLLGFVGISEPDLSHYSKLKELGITTILGTLGNLDKSAIAKGSDEVYRQYVKNGADVIATDRPLEVAKVIYNN